MTPTTLHSQQDLPVGDGPLMRLHIARPDVPGPVPGVVVAHELFGVNDGITAILEEFAQQGFLAVTPEFYHRHAPAGRVLPKTDDGRAEAFGLLRQLSRQQAVDNVAAALDWLHAQSDVTAAVAILGFSAGGHIAWLAGSVLDFAAVAVIYGGWITTTEMPIGAPEPTVFLTPGMKGRLVYAVGGADHVISAAQRGELESALTDAGVRHELLVYPGVGHAFFWPGEPAFDQAARDDAWAHVVGLFSEELR